MKASSATILITGASSGIGQALALEYAAPGITLLLSGRDRNRLEDTQNQCRARGAQVVSALIDVQDKSAMETWIREVDASHRIDLVIANAGVSHGTGQGGSEEDQVRDIFSINMAGTLNTVLPAIDLMKQRNRGQIALLSSLAGFRGLPTAPAYAASKAAVRSYGEGLRGRLAPDGIRVNVICPGFVRSRITDQNDFPMPFFMEADKAAKIIRKGLEQNKPRIAFPWQTYALVRIISALPLSLTDRFLRRGPQKI